MILLNGNQQTHFNTANGTESAIDLAISQVDVAENISMIVSDELYGSDHYPIILQVPNLLNTEYQCQNSAKIRNYKKANWKLYKEEINKGLSLLDVPTINNKKALPT